MGFFVNMVIVFLLGRVANRIFSFLGNNIRFLRPLLLRLLRIGVIFHELSHFIIAKILLIPVKFSDINFHTKDGGGEVTFYKTEEYIKRISFLKDLLIDVAPLWVGNWAIMELYRLLMDLDVIGLKILAGLGIFVISLVCVPSNADIKKLFETINLKPYVFIKQAIFLVLSFIIYNLYFDYFYQYAPIYPYLFEFFILLIIEGMIELLVMILKFGAMKILMISNNKPLGFFNGGSGHVREMFPSRRERRKNKKMSRSELFSLLPADDETAAEEFAQAMIENNAMMIDIENPEEE